MIEIPFDEPRALGAITEVIAELVKHRDHAIACVARSHRTVEGVAKWIRSLPPGAPCPCVPRRLRIPAPDPACAERAALYIAVAELIDPRAVRKLATRGAHTIALENGFPVVLGHGRRA